MYYVMRASAPSLHRESTDSLIRVINTYNIIHSFNSPCKRERRPEIASSTPPPAIVPLRKTGRLLRVRTFSARNTNKTTTYKVKVTQNKFKC